MIFSKDHRSRERTNSSSNSSSRGSSSIYIMMTHLGWALGVCSWDADEVPSNGTYPGKMREMITRGSEWGVGGAGAGLIWGERGHA